MTGKILAVMSDLFFSVKITDAAKKLGMTAEFVKDKTLALAKIKAEGTARPPLIIIDLNCEAADPLGLIAAVKGDPATAGIGMIGFVSHVQAELKQRAERAGCDTVVARSVFARDLAAILQRTAGHATPGQSREAD